MTTTDCEAALRLLHRAHDGEASADERATADGHCAACASCARARDELGALRGLLGLLAEAPPRPLGEVARARFAARLQAEQASERYWDEAGRLARRWTRVAAAAAAALLVAAGLLVDGSSAAVQTASAGAEQQVDVQGILLGQEPVTADVAATLTIQGVPR